MRELEIRSSTADIVGAVLVFLLSAGALYTTTLWIPPVLPGDPGAAFFPRIAIVAMLVFAMLLLVQTVLGRRRQRAVAGEDPIIKVKVAEFLQTVLGSGLFVAGIAWIGFEAPAFVFLFVYLGVRTGRWGRSAIIAAIAVVIMWFFFIILLRVRMPLLLLPEYLPIF